MLIEIDKDISVDEALRITEKELDEGQNKQDTLNKIKEKQSSKQKIPVNMTQ